MRTFITVVLVIAAAVAGYLYNYAADFGALRNEIERQPHLKITHRWQHRDTTLEDFGFTVQSAEWEFQLDVVDGSSVRGPEDRAAGLVVKGYPRAAGMEVVEFGSAYWTAHGLPPLSDIAGFLKHSDQILKTIADHPPPTTTADTYPYPAFLDHIYVVARKKPGVSRAK